MSVTSDIRTIKSEVFDLKNQTSLCTVQSLKALCLGLISLVQSAGVFSLLTFKNFQPFAGICCSILFEVPPYSESEI